MSRFAPTPARGVRRAIAPTLTSVSRFRWQARRGTLDAITGQVGTLTRASTGTAVDITGTTYTARHSMPRWENRDFNAGGSRYELGLRMTADDLEWAANWLPETGTFYVEFSEEGTRTTTGAGLLYLGRDDQTGARLFVNSSGTNYQATIHNGTTSQTIALATATPTTGQMARLAVQLLDSGGNQQVRLILRVGSGSDTTTAYTTAITRAAAWGTGAKLRLNRIGNAGTQGSTWVRQVAYAPGLLSIDDMAARL